MIGKVFTVAAGMVLMSAGLTFGQPSTFADPAELPPPGFQGQQYVDSRGCTFMRAGFGGTVTWVPRVTADRKQMCAPPEAATETAAAATDAPAAAPPVVADAPMAEPAKVQKKKIRRVVAPPPPTPPGMRMACPVATPYLEQLRGPTGDSKLYCTHGDGTTAGATLPRLVNAGTVVGHVSGVTITPPSDSVPAIPKGYVSAWKDDRLNPNRPKAATAGSSAQNKVGASEGLQAPVPDTAPATAVAMAGGRLFVQVGSFGVAANAQNAQARLTAMGLPVARKGTRLNGKAVEVVFAGPFGTTAEAQSAQKAARQAGFGDAFIVR